MTPQPRASTNPAAEQSCISPAEYAALRGCSMATVRRYLKAGKIAHEQPGGFRCRIFIAANLAKPDSPTVTAPPSAGVDETSAPGMIALAATPSTDRRHGPRPSWRSRNQV
jgi:hypothetical protein